MQTNKHKSGTFVARIANKNREASKLPKVNSGLARHVHERITKKAEGKKKNKAKKEDRTGLRGYLDKRRKVSRWLERE